jgi:hypothetical protein
MLIRAFLFILFTIAIFFVKVAHAAPNASPAVVSGAGSASFH